MYYVITACSYAEGYQPIPHTIEIVVPGIEKPVLGDMNSDGVVNIADVSAVINAILRHNSEMKYDFDGDGKVTISDVTTLIAFVLSGQ